MLMRCVQKCARCRQELSKRRCGTVCVCDVVCRSALPAAAAAAAWWNRPQPPAVDSLWAFTLKSALPYLEKQHWDPVPDLPLPSAAVCSITSVLWRIELQIQVSSERLNIHTQMFRVQTQRNTECKFLGQFNFFFFFCVEGEVHKISVTRTHTPN